MGRASHHDLWLLAGKRPLFYGSLPTDNSPTVSRTQPLRPTFSTILSVAIIYKTKDIVPLAQEVSFD